MTTTSDYRLKTDVTNLINQLETLRQLRPVSYTHMWDNQTHQGFLAHELQLLFPDCVSGSKDQVDGQGNPMYQGVSVGFSLIATIIASLKEVDAVLTELQSDYNTIKADFLAVKADHVQLKADFTWHKTHSVAVAHPLI